MNSLCNGKLHKRYPAHNIFIPPCPDDSGIAIGATIVGLLKNGEKLKEVERRIIHTQDQNIVMKK